MSELTLYQYEMCPFCVRVRSKLEEKGLEYKKVNVTYDSSDPTRKEIAEKSGVTTVPVLKIGDGDDAKYIGESSDIIEYLDEKY